MQTIYFRTSNFIQHSGNVVDLDEFRRRTALAQQDSLARQPEAAAWMPEVWSQEDGAPETDWEETGFQPIVLTMDKKTLHRIHRERRAWALDACASIGVIAMTLVFLLRIIL